MSHSGLDPESRKHILYKVFIIHINILFKTPRPNLYDYLKIIAIVLMIIDHLWFFFFPEALWMRLLGRGAFPIFLTLVWLSGNYKRRRDLFLWAMITQIPIAIYAISNELYGFLTLNILRSIIIARASIYILHTKETKRYITISLALLPILPLTQLAFDYGAFAIYFAIRWAMLHQKKTTIITSLYGASIWTLMMIFSIPSFHFTATQQTAVRIYAGIHIILMYILQYQNFTIHIHPKRDKTIHRIAKKALIIYIIHLTIFVIIKAILWHILA